MSPAIGGLDWSLSPLSLLTLRPAVDFRLSRLDGFATGRLSAPLFGDTVRIADLEAATALAALPAALAPNGLAGQFSARFADITLEDGWPTRVAGSAGIADLALPGVLIVLGPLEFVFEGDASPPAAAVRSLGGPLAVDGTLTLPAPGRWSLEALLGPGENPPRELVEGLAYVGEEAPGGRRRVQYSGEI